MEAIMENGFYDHDGNFQVANFEIGDDFVYPQDSGASEKVDEQNITHNALSEKKTFLWKIPNFVELQNSDSNANNLCCTIDTCGDLGEHFPQLKWQCKLQEEQEGEQGSGFYGIVVSYTPSPQPEKWNTRFAEIRFHILDKSKKTFFNKGITVRVSRKDPKPGYGHHIPKVIPKNVEERPFLTEDGALEVFVTITIKFPNLQNPVLALLEEQYQQKFAKSFRANMEFIRENPLDVCSKATKIVSKDGKEFPVDRVILAARSSVFQGMFQSNMSEAEAGVVQVKDIDSEPLAVLLDYLHTGVLTENWKNEKVIQGLVYGADKYMLQDLKKFLDKTLGLVCTQDNCGKLMALARTFKMAKAEQQLLKYFKNNMVNTVPDVLLFAVNVITRPVPVVGAENAAEGREPKRQKVSEEAAGEKPAQA